MARMAVAHTKSSGSAARQATANPTGDVVVDIDLSKITTITQLRTAFDRILLEFAGGKELTS